MADPERSRQLLTLLADLERLHGDLLTCVTEKVDRMRTADVVGIRNCVEREQALIQRVGQREGCRRQLLDRWGRSLGMSAATARRMSATDLAARLAEPTRTRLLAAAQRLRSLMDRLAAMNRRAGLIARSLLAHVEQIYAAAIEPPAPNGAYSAGGRTVTAPPQRLFEATV